ncbi:MAG: RNA methyltransferase [Candidatus Nezhaarchaeales archaeon]
MRLVVALPSTVVAEANSLLEKTVKIGFMARALSIFKVKELLIYRDVSTEVDEGRLVGKLFEYAICPQYLRKKLFPLDPDLKYVGILPPLNTPNHPMEKSIEELPDVTYREGLVVSRKGRKCLVDVGLDRNVVLYNAGELKKGDRVVLKITKKNGTIEAYKVKREDVPQYFGYEVCITDFNLKGVISSFKGRALIVATSRYGRNINEDAPILVERMKEHRYSVLLLFGSPFRGLYELAKREGFDLDKTVDMVLNFVPEQGVRTVRVEEALYSTLAIINFLYHYFK